VSWQARRWLLLGAFCLGIALTLVCTGYRLVAPVAAFGALACWVAALSHWNLTQALRESDRLQRERSRTPDHK
jgi:hypothetical protein